MEEEIDLSPAKIQVGLEKANITCPNCDRSTPLLEINESQKDFYANIFGKNCNYKGIKTLKVFITINSVKKDFFC